MGTVHSSIYIDSYIFFVYFTLPLRKLGWHGCLSPPSTRSLWVGLDWVYVTGPRLFTVLYEEGFVPDALAWRHTGCHFFIRRRSHIQALACPVKRSQEAYVGKNKNKKNFLLVTGSMLWCSIRHLHIVKDFTFMELMYSGQVVWLRSLIGRAKILKCFPKGR